jgi:hypothetical protein
MIRELIKPIDNTYLLNLPDEMIGKNIEVIAFEIENDDKSVNEVKSIQSIQNIKESYARLPRISHDNYQFNRDEANDNE